MAGLAGIVAPTSSYAADRRVFGTLVDEIARPIDADDSTVRALAMDAIRAAIRKFNAMGGWPWEIQTVEITQASGQATYTLPTPFKKEISLHRLDATGGNPDDRLLYVPYQTFITAYDLSRSGTPIFYSAANVFETGQLSLYPIPQAADFLQLDYYRETPRPTSESTPMEIPEYALEAYMAEAWYEFLKRLPSERRLFDLGTARADAFQMMGRIKAFVNTPGDSARVV